MKKNEDIQIDVVITWVDGHDPEHRRKRMKYQIGGDLRRVDIGGDTRFNSLGEINYCVASINKYAPFVRKIYIVTDNQDPQVDKFMDKNFPGNRIPMEIVDHTTIFRGYEQYLPVFNSLAIETMLWRIPGLSEYYIYLNDDFSLIGPVTEEDFIRKGKMLVNGSRRIVPFSELKEKVHTYRKGGVPLVTLRRTLLNASEILGDWKMIKLVHAPQMLRKSIFEEYYREHEEAIIHNIKHRFRDITQYNASALHYLLAMKNHEVKLVNPAKKLLYINPKRYQMKRTLEKLAIFTKKKKARYFCINSLDLASPDVQKAVVGWLNDRLHGKL